MKQQNRQPVRARKKQSRANTAVFLFLPRNRLQIIKTEKNPKTLSEFLPLLALLASESRKDFLTRQLHVRMPVHVGIQLHVGIQSHVRIRLQLHVRIQLKSYIPLISALCKNWSSCQKNPRLFPCKKNT